MASEAMLSDEQLIAFDEIGYFIMQNFLSTVEVDSIRREITNIVERYPDVPKELVQFEPTQDSTNVDGFELRVRKLFRMALHNKFFRDLAYHHKMVGVAVELLGPDVTLFQSMLLMKPPRVGTQKVWHQDNAYFRLEPNEIFGFWIALDEATIENGCMHLIPGSHKNGIGKHGGIANDYGLTTAPNRMDTVACSMNTGDALVFHGEIYHYTPANKTDLRRRALQYHYASTHCISSKDTPFKAAKPEAVVGGLGARHPV